MKKYLYSALAACSLLSLGACSADEPINNGTNGELVNFTVKMTDAPTTRMFGRGHEATRLTYAIYEKGETNPFIQNDVENAFDENLETTLSLRLVAGKTYEIIFWAQNPSCPDYTFSPSDKTITVKYDNAPAANATGNTRDAFSASRSFTVTASGQAINETIILTRPFAQINVGTCDLNEPAVINLKNLKTSITLEAYTTFNILTGDATDPQTVTIPAAGRPNPISEEFPVIGGYNGKALSYLSCDYILRNGEALQDIDLTFSDKNGVINTINLTNVPTQRNYRTNIYGALLTSGYDYIIKIDPAFDGGYDEIYPAQ